MSAIFDRAAHDYDFWYQTEMGQTVDEIEKDLVYRLLKPRPGHRLLEMGCGTGNYTVELARRGVQVTGIDISEQMLAKGREKLAAAGLTARLLHGDFLAMSFPPAEFDLVLSVTALEFFPDPQQALTLAYHSLKPGGRMVIGVIAGNSPWSQAYQAAAAAKEESVFKHAKFYTKEELLSFLPVDEPEVLTGLYFPPNFTDFERKAALAVEQASPARIQPGFICACWSKPHG